MNFDGGGQNLLTQCCRTLFIRQRLQEKIDGFADVGQSLLDRPAL
jgi:hypothetical protein